MNDAQASDDAPLPSTSTPKPGDSYVQSFARGLAVIRAFNAQAPKQTLTEVARHCGLTRAGARRILLTLEALGYVRSEGRMFMLTPRILDLGFAYLSSQPLWHLAEPLMQDLATELNESCSAAVLDGTDVVYVMRIPARKIMSINLGVGSRLPAWCTSLGRVLLASLPDIELDRVLQNQQLKPFTSRTVRSKDELRHRIRMVRSQGWCLVNQELEEGLASLAAPIVDRHGHTIAALNIGAQVNRRPPDAMVSDVLPRLLHTAAGISRLLQLKS